MDSRFVTPTQFEGRREVRLPAALDFTLEELA